MSEKSQITTLDSADDAALVAAKAAPKKLKGANHDVALSGDKKTITIHPSEGEGGSDAVNVGVNGYVYQIPRGEPFEVPSEVVEVLKNAVQTSLSFGEGGKVVERSMPRYAFSVH